MRRRQMIQHVIQYLVAVQLVDYVIEGVAQPQHVSLVLGRIGVHHVHPVEELFNVRPSSVDPGVRGVKGVDGVKGVKGVVVMVVSSEGDLCRSHGRRVVYCSAV